MEHKTIRLTNSSGVIRPFDVIVDDIINLALDHCDGNKTVAAKRLAMPRSTFYRKLKAGE